MWFYNLKDKILYTQWTSQDVPNQSFKTIFFYKKSSYMMSYNFGVINIHYIRKCYLLLIVSLRLGTWNRWFSDHQHRCISNVIAIWWWSFAKVETSRGSYFFVLTLTPSRGQRLEEGRLWILWIFRVDSVCSRKVNKLHDGKVKFYVQIK